MQAEQLIKEGKPREALKALEQEVRSHPASAKHRVFLFQLLTVLGEWDRALTQLRVAGEMDRANDAMAKIYLPALQCEALREAVFKGERKPLVLGEPVAWVAQLIEASRLDATGESGQAAELRAQALEAAPTVAGEVNGEAFEWIADADSRLGPMLELVLDGRYFWVPFTAIGSIEFEEAADLRDVVWQPASVTWSNGGEAVALVPTRYAGTVAHDDGALLLGRKTEWQARSDDCYAGCGQRILVTDAGEYPLLTIRTLALHHGTA